MRILAALLSPLLVLATLACTGPLGDVGSIGRAAGAVARLATTDWSRHADAPHSALDQFEPPPPPIRTARPRLPLPQASPCPFGAREACRTMERALARGDLAACVHHRWRRLFRFRSLEACREFVRENAGEEH